PGCVLNHSSRIPPPDPRQRGTEPVYGPKDNFVPQDMRVYITVTVKHQLRKRKRERNRCRVFWEFMRDPEQIFEIKLTIRKE
ncbi:hypothetical protein JXQ70_11385, partial [bacterium]|nr:hypothetical protein [bacterium]